MTRPAKTLGEAYDCASLALTYLFERQQPPAGAPESEAPWSSEPAF